MIKALQTKLMSAGITVHRTTNKSGLGVGSCGTRCLAMGDLRITSGDASAGILLTLRSSIGP